MNLGYKADLKIFSEILSALTFSHVGIDKTLECLELIKCQKKTVDEIKKLADARIKQVREQARLQLLQAQQNAHFRCVPSITNHNF